MLTVEEALNQMEPEQRQQWEQVLREGEKVKPKLPFVNAAQRIEVAQELEQDRVSDERRPMRGNGAAGWLSHGVPPAKQGAANIIYLVTAAIVVIAIAALVMNYLNETPTTTTINGTPVATTEATVAATAAVEPVLTFAVATLAYAAPGGSVIGPLDAGREYTPIAKYGNTWVQVDVGTPGKPNKVWVKADTVIVQVALPDLTPKPTAIPAAAPVAVEPACTLADQKFSTTLTVYGKIKSGQVVGYGCTQAEADANAAKLAEEYK